MLFSNEEKYRSWVEISESSIRHNIESVQSILTNDTDLVAVVKSNAYGHGLAEIVKIAYKSGIKRFAVDSVQEAFLIRKMYSDVWILVMGYMQPQDILQVVKNNISFVAYSDSYLPELNKIPDGLEAKIHLKIETGTMRQGLRGDELRDFVKQIQKISKVEIEGMYTHFANIEDTTDHSFAENQLQNFNEAMTQLKEMGVDPKLKHAACSAAMILLKETHFSVARLGISLYGLWSSKETQAISKQKNKGFTLKTALTWKTVIAQIKEAKAGTPIGYGLTESVARDSKLAIVPVGYWDGYDRGLSGVGNVLVNGVRCKIIGRICMNMMIVDVTDASGAAVLDEVVLMGAQGKDEITADSIAGKLNTINYEVVTRINPMIPRIIIE